MAAARCAECGEYSVERGDGTATIRHSPTCETGNDYQPKLNETLSMRDIVVQSTLAEVESIVEKLIQAYIDNGGLKPRFPEIHFILKYEDNADSSAHFVEVRGKVRNVSDGGEDAVFRIVGLSIDSDTIRVVVYKPHSRSEDEPDEATGIDISRMMRRDATDGGVHQFMFAAFQLQSISIIHEPSPTLPVIEKPVNYRLGCQDEDGRPVHPDCVTPGSRCGCGTD